MRQTFVFLFISFLLSCDLLSSHASAQIYVSEIVANNDGSLQDIDGDEPDWIELFNNSTNRVSLEGWFLTDNHSNLTQWRFPAVEIEAQGFLVLFASEKDPSAGGELHTNFKLDAEGEYIALVRPDGTTIENAFQFPGRLEEASWGYGFSGGSSTTSATLVDSGTFCTAHVPTNSTDSSDWMLADFNDNMWQRGTLGVGYEHNSAYFPYIGLDVDTEMFDKNASLYTRIPFTHDGLSVKSLLLRMKYDDGFVAYLNGTKIAAVNAPSIPLWNSSATDSHSDNLAVVFQDFDVSTYSDLLLKGTNILAIHGLNSSATSADLLLLAQLEAVYTSNPNIMPSEIGVLSSPTPGAPNSAVIYDGFCGIPAVFPERGFYDAPIQVTLSNITENAQIRYTTDGSMPTESNGMLYTGPISVTNTTLLRAAAFKPNYQASAPSTQTYLFLDNIIQQDGSNLQAYADWGHAGPDWAVDPSMADSIITDFDGRSFDLEDALLDIPTVSLVTDWDYWWSDSAGPTLGDGTIPWLGIYADMVGQSAVRRPVSMEFFTADGSETFVSDGSVCVVGGGIGGTSANRWKSDKLSLRVSFTDKLKYPVYGDDAAQQFNGLVLDAHLNWTWTHAQQSSQRHMPKYMAEAVSSDLLNAMADDKGAPHTRFVHLYLNGLYWGLYEMHERPDEHFAAEYFGGQNEDYDSIKHFADDGNGTDSDHDGDPYNDNITNGDDADYQAMLALSRTDLSQQPNYETLAARLDIEGLIDYMLMNFFVGNTDWAHKNWYATCNQIDPDGRWRYHAWDTEHIMESLYTNVTEKDDSGGPTEVHQNLCTNEEYRLQFADHIHRHFFNDGPLTTNTFSSLFQHRLREIQQAILGEAARWADNTPNEGHDYDEWRNSMQGLINNYVPNRSNVVLNQLTSQNLYPDTPAPEFTVNDQRQHGGLVSSTDTIRTIFSFPVYYTTDGSDPRAIGGAIVGTEYTGAITINAPTQIKARAWNGSEWSALCEAVYWTEEIPLAFTELMYHAPSNQLDFVEIRNTSDEPVNLYGYKIDSAVDFKFGNMTLNPGEFLVALKDIDGFSAVYATNNMTIGGEYRGDFDNSGETVQLEFHNHDLISFHYSDARNWPQAADGGGHSLIPLDHAMETETAGSLNYGGNWRASTYAGGSPGFADPEPGESVLLNEVIAHTDTGEAPPFESNDQIELYNPSSEDIALNGFYLSDDLDELNKWAIPNGTVVPANGFVLFDEDDFHANRVDGFGLDKAGEMVVLSSISGVSDIIRFKGQENGASLGRYPDGAANWITTESTPNATNRPAATSVWISELMYNPPAPQGYADGDMLEYIQLENRSATSVPFVTTAGAWRIDGGVSYTFSADFTLPAGEKVWLVSFDPSNTAQLDFFCSTYGLNAAEETILGPYKGQLSNEGERVALERPQDSDDPLLPLDISWIVVDELFYFDQAPWPNADGTGYPLIRTALTSWGASSLSDTDADELDDEWENSWFGSLAQNGNDDFDNDGFNNRQEQIAGTDPTDHASRFRVESAEAPTLRWTAVEGRTYSIYWTDDLQNPFTQIESGITYPQNSYTDNLHTNHSGYYYISVEQE